MLPTSLKYQSKVESSASRCYRTNLAPQSGTGPYQLGDTVIFNISTRSNLCLSTIDSCLKLKMNITSNNASNNFRFDSSGIASCIRRIRVFSGSNLLEDIDSYGMLSKIMNDLYHPTDSTYGKLNIVAGTRNDTVTISGASFVASSGLPGLQVNSGDLVGTGSQYIVPFAANASPSNVSSGTIISDTYCINLISILGSLSSSNYFPLFACTSAPIRLEITLASSLSDIVLQKVTTVPNTVTFTNVEYIAQYIELGDSAMANIYSSLNGDPLQYVTSGYRNYQFNASLPNNTQTQLQMPIPAKFSSLKSIVVSQRDQYGTSNFFPNSSVSMGISQYQWRAGSIVLPSKPPETISEMFGELVKVAGAIADLAYQPSIERFTYQQYQSINGVTLNATAPMGTNTIAVTIDTATSVSNCNSGSFYVGVDFENYPSTEKSKIFAGYNSNTDEIYFNPTYTQNTGSVQNLRFDAYANFDQVLVFENDTCFAKF
jgi:hypothetical protein